jgi:hypothetical protein
VPTYIHGERETVGSLGMVTCCSTTETEIGETRTVLSVYAWGNVIHVYFCIRIRRLQVKSNEYLQVLTVVYSALGNVPAYKCSRIK